MKIKKSCRRCKKKRFIKGKGLCKPCYSQRINKKNPNFKENVKRWRDKNLKYFRDYYRNMPKEQKERVLKKARESRKRYYRKNKEEILKKGRKYYIKNRKRLLKYSKIYQKEYLAIPTNREKRRRYIKKYGRKRK